MESRSQSEDDMLFFTGGFVFLVMFGKSWPFLRAFWRLFSILSRVL